MEKSYIIYLSSVNTALGRFEIAAGDRGVRMISLPGTAKSGLVRMLSEDFAGFAAAEHPNAIAEQCARELAEYFAGERTIFEVPLDIHATDFRRRVYRELRAIPFGETVTYGELAARVGNPKAARAVGSANAANPIPIIVPCHRVVAVNGLGGYAGGLDTKRKLLELEGVRVDG